MRFRRIAILFASLLIVPYGSYAADEKPLTNGDVIAMVKAGLPESTILLSVKSAPEDFATGAQDLIELQQAGVTPAVMEAMVARNGESAASSVGAGPQGMPPGSTGMPPGAQGVIAIDGQRRVQLSQATPMAYKSKMSLWSAVLPTASIKQSLTFQGAKANIRLASARPMFEVAVPASVPVSQFVGLIRLDVDNKEDARIAPTFDARNPLGKNAIDTTAQEATDVQSSGYYKTYRLTPAADLSAGEYGILFVGSIGQVWDFGID